MKHWNLLAVLVALTMFIGFAQATETKTESETEKSVFNNTCPIADRPVNASKTSDFKVEFCCNNCKGKFEKDPGKHLAKAADAEKGTCIFNGRPAKTSSTVTVGFCCGGCKGKFDKAPTKYIAKVKPAKTEG